MKKYKITFEYISPFTGQWTAGSRESEDLESIRQQVQGQSTLSDVRNTEVYESTVCWTKLK